MVGFRLCPALADCEHGPLNVAHEASAGERNLGALFDLVDDARFVLQDACQLLGIGREAGALHALMLQVGVEAKALGGQGLARDLCHRAQHGARIVKGKARVAFAPASGTKGSVARTFMPSAPQSPRNTPVKSGPKCRVNGAARC